MTQERKEAAQTENTPKDAYQYLLLKTVSPNYSMALTSNFYNSLIKKRINPHLKIDARTFA